MPDSTRSLVPYCTFLLGLLLLTAVCRAAGAASGEEFALMHRADQQKILLGGAKQEGKISCYTTLIVGQVVRPVKAPFEKEYPCLQLQFFRGTADRLMQKMFAEYQAKRYDVDIIDG